MRWTDISTEPLLEITYNQIDRDDTGIYHDDKLPGRKRKPDGVILPFTIDNFKVFAINYYGEINVSAYDGSKKIAKLILDAYRFKDFSAINTYSIQGAGVLPAYQGRGIGQALYEGLVKLCNINLCSFDSHSAGARKLWMRSSQDPKIMVWAVDINDQLRGTKPSLKKQELIYDNDKPLYGHSHGLIMTKRNGRDDKYLQTIFVEQQKARKSKQPKKDIFGTDFSEISVDY